MELRALRYFVEVVRQQSFTAAAEQMFVTQPTISKMVKALEDEIGSPLLLRDSRQMTLTDAGRIVYQRGQDVLAAQAQLQAELDDLAELGRGELTIGIPPLGGAAFTPAIAAFRQRYPNIELKLYEQGARTIETALAAGELELGGVLEPVDPAVFDVLRMVRAPLWLVARRGARWDREDAVPLADLAGEPFVFYAEALALHQAVLDACAQAGFTPSIVSRSGHWDFMAALVQAGVGIALLPEPYCRRLDPAQFSCRPIVEPEIQWSIAVGWLKRGYLSHAARAWLDVAREVGPADPDGDLAFDSLRIWGQDSGRR
ncbi:LysR family transcriptional regulator [Burkholderia sp. Ac-20379]|uniref:LysR family transcriptional regulator n=1 Tax=Burkholderia sp. Ac-20379 TaxID=2703900 RepID=UPI00197E3E34|nr:LysR family transcriptional regulator [Burkholderia sp. Ac-20379]MBN3728244.1 LysR family transcriptional regulator [Burkholderia sp. Ac-20379]